MPNIRVLDNPITELQPSNLGVGSLEQEARLQRVDFNEAGTAIGSGIATAGNTGVGLLARHQELTELNQGSAAGNTMWLNLTNQWNQLAANSDPNDPSIQGQFIQKSLEPALEKFKDGFQTQKGQAWAQSYADQIRTHFFDKTTADLSNRAGSAFSSNNATSTNALAQNVYNDPSGLDTALKLSDSTIDAQVGSSGLDASASGVAVTTMKDDARNGVTKAGLLGMIAHSPQQFLADEQSGALDKYAPNLKPGEMDTLVRQAGVAAKGQIEAAKVQQTAKNTADKQSFQSYLLDTQKGYWNPDGTINAAGVANGLKSLTSQGPTQRGADLSVPALRSSIDFTMKLAKEAANPTNTPTDVNTFDDLRARMYLKGGAATSMQQIQDAYVAGLLNVAGYRKLEGQFNNRNDPQDKGQNAAFDGLINAYKGFIVKKDALGTTVNPQGDVNFNQFRQDADDAFQAGLAAGVPYRDLLNPTNTHFILGPHPSKFVQKYMVPSQDAQQVPEEVPQTQGTTGAIEQDTTFNSPSGKAQGPAFKEAPELNPGEGKPFIVQGLGGSPVQAGVPAAKKWNGKMTPAEFAAYLQEQNK